MIDNSTTQAKSNTPQAIFLCGFLALTPAIFLPGIIYAQTNVATTPQGLANFANWATLAMGQRISPAMPLAKRQDLTESWTGPDGQQVELLVRQPAGLNNRVRLVVPPVARGQDARPYFQKALAAAVTRGANTLSLTPGATYTFLTTESAYNSHLLLQNLSDFIIEGNGAALNFSLNKNGILIQQSQRLRIENLSIAYTFLSTSLGQMISHNGHNVLVINSQYPVNADVKIAQIAQINPAASKFIVGGARLIFATPAAGPVYVGNQTYQWSAFDKLPSNSSYMVIHHFYGGEAIRVDGFRTTTQTEDITFSGINIHSTPGVGMLVTGLKRGFALLKSSFAPDPDSTTNFGGPSWDGIDLVSGGGDILIQDNEFKLLGDDAINVYSPIHQVIAMEAATNTVTLSNSSRFINRGDQLAFFDAEGQFLGEAQVVYKTVGDGIGDYAATVNSIPPNVAVNSYARNVSFLTSRFFFDSNVVQNTNGHGILAQIPNGLISNNAFNNLDRNAIRLMSSIGNWNEGIGAFNVKVHNNTVTNGGVDIDGSNIPWSSITVYGQGVDGKLSHYLMNENIEISGNTLLGLSQGCLGITVTENVSMFNNVCKLNFPNRYSNLTIFQSENVTSH